MGEWSVYVEAVADENFGETNAEALLDAPEGHSTAVSFGHGTAAARFSIGALSAQEAAGLAAGKYLAAFTEGRITYVGGQSRHAAGRPRVGNVDGSETKRGTKETDIGHDG